jgi:predicted dehydrogenase
VGVLERNHGFPQEMEHFVDCVLNDKPPLVTGDDGRAVMEIIFAAYESAGTGRRIEWPYEAPRDKTPIEFWLQQ